mmetsp:Transcript_19541/g.64891  ORF Transcript_19541/g.64891 Transcript_19541/m.64891 type:complete len:225 (+) Transcript_19541:1192-1866(+)
MCYERMIELNFQPGSDLMNTYIECLAASKNPEHHELAWGMYLRALRAGHMKASSHVAMYDSCTVHARIGRLTEVAHHMGEARTAELGKKRLEALARARKILESAPGQDLYTKKARSQSDASRNSRTPVVSRLSSWNSMKQQQVGAVDGWLRLKHLLQTPSVEIPKAQVKAGSAVELQQLHLRLSSRLSATRVSFKGPRLSRLQARRGTLNFFLAHVSDGVCCQE